MPMPPTSINRTAATTRAISKVTKTNTTTINITTKGRQLQGSNPSMDRAAMGSCPLHVVCELCLKSAEPSQSAVVTIQKKTQRPLATSP